MKGIIFATLATYMVYVVYAAPSADCPSYENIKEPVLVPHPCNCSAYYVCVPPANIPMPCPPGLQFNRTTQRCDWPWNVHCVPHPDCNKVYELNKVAPIAMQEVTWSNLFEQAREMVPEEPKQVTWSEVFHQVHKVVPQEVPAVVSQEETS